MNKCLAIWQHLEAANCTLHGNIIYFFLYGTINYYFRVNTHLETTVELIFRWYGRYIDDLLLVWEGTGVQAEVFVQYMNSNNSNFKFTHIFHETKVHFLDITLEGDMTNGVVISPYRKSMSRNATLLATSCHPKHVVENIPLGELVRTKRNCTHLDTFFKQQDSVCERLQARR